MTLAKAGLPIVDLEDWRTRAGPKSATQWVDGRSAKELAKAWLGTSPGRMPREVEAAIAAHPHFGPIASWEAEPEVKLRFDDFAGEPRNTDLAIHMQDQRGRYLVAVEAKADESFGETVVKTLAAAEVRRSANPRSNGVARVHRLVELLIGTTLEEDSSLLQVRYQLLTACAGALAEARRRAYTRAVMLVHEFVTEKTADRNHARNALDLSNFLRLMLPSASAEIEESRLYGPWARAGAALPGDGVALYIGKVSTNLRP